MSSKDGAEEVQLVPGGQVGCPGPLVAAPHLGRPLPDLLQLQLLPHLLQPPPLAVLPNRLGVRRPPAPL